MVKQILARHMGQDTTITPDGIHLSSIHQGQVLRNGKGRQGAVTDCKAAMSEMEPGWSCDRPTVSLGRSQVE